jgi:4-hydroxybenzoate polyprenyltransferase
LVPSIVPDFLQHNSNFLFFLLVVSSVFIAGAGYIINDYFDVKIDAINKPEKVIVGKRIKRRWAIFFHLFLSVLGLGTSIYVAWKSSWWLGLANLICIFLLWIYSVKYKKELAVGNFIIAALTAWVILSVYVFVIGISGESSVEWRPMLLKYAFLYAGFAFITTIIREVIKDMEDTEGDRQFHSNTMPIAWGIPTTKVFTAVWIIVCIGLLFSIIGYAMALDQWGIIIYILLALIFPFFYLLYKLKQANGSKDYHALSTQVKIIMLLGILSMCIFIIPGF